MEQSVKRVSPLATTKAYRYDRLGIDAGPIYRYQLPPRRIRYRGYAMDGLGIIGVFVTVAVFTLLVWGLS